MSVAARRPKTAKARSAAPLIQTPESRTPVRRSATRKSNPRFAALASRAAPARQSRASRATRQDLLQRLHALRATRIECMEHESFGADTSWADPMPLAVGDVGNGSTSEPVVVAGGRFDAGRLGPLGDAPLLKPAEEAALFRRMNLLKHHAQRFLGDLDEDRLSAAEVERVERLLTEACELRNRILQSNLRLVVSVAKHYANLENPLADLVSDGNMTLLRAIEKFDFSRGFRFSTYATWALRKNYQRALGREQRLRSRFLPSDDEIKHAAAPAADDAAQTEVRLDRLRRAVAEVLQTLDPRERSIVSARFGLDAESRPQTLSELGAALGISKERVRQLESRALDKLRVLGQRMTLVFA